MLLVSRQSTMTSPALHHQPLKHQQINNKLLTLYRDTGAYLLTQPIMTLPVNNKVYPCWMMQWFIIIFSVIIIYTLEYNRSFILEPVLIKQKQIEEQEQNNHEY